MSWNELIGHREWIDAFRSMVQRAHVGSSFLFIGPAGIGKRKFALLLTQALLCQKLNIENFEPCGSCPSCVQVRVGTHPDLHIVERPKDRSFIPLELLIGPPEARMRVGLCHEISLRPMLGQRKVAIIDDADYMNEEGANSLLKTLEEPPPHSTLILIGTSEQRQLPTIRSRCQIVRFRPLDEKQILTLLERIHGEDKSLEQLQDIAKLAHGSLSRAELYLDDDLFEFRKQLFDQLTNANVTRGDFAKVLNNFVDSAGESTRKRRRLNDVVDMTLEYYRAVLKALVRQAEITDSVLLAAVEKTISENSWDVELIADAMQCCLNVQAGNSSNANQSNLIEFWLIELSRILRRQTIVSDSIYAH